MIKSNEEFELLRRITRIIKSAKIDQKEIVERYITICENSGIVFSVFGKAHIKYCINHTFYEKFGKFTYRHETLSY